MNFKSTLTLALLVAVSARAAVQVEGSLTLNGETKPCNATIEFDETCAMNDNISITVHQTEDDQISIEAEVSDVDAEGNKTVVSKPCMLTSYSQEATVRLGKTVEGEDNEAREEDVMELTLTVEKIEA